MTKQEILNLFDINNVKLDSLESFLVQNKELKLNRKSCVKWIMTHEKTQKEKKEKRLLRVAANRLNLSLKNYLLLREKAYRILEDFETAHKMGCLKEIYINSNLFIKIDEREEYTNSKYSATHGYITIIFSKIDLQKIEKIEGLWTVKQKSHKAKWLTDTGSKFVSNIEFKNGFLFGTSHGETLKAAKDTFKKRYLKSRDVNFKNSRFVGFKHFTDSGACPDGIKAFAIKHNLNLDYGYNLGFLKSLDKNNPFLNSVL